MLGPEQAFSKPQLVPHRLHIEELASQNRVNNRIVVFISSLQSFSERNNSDLQFRIYLLVLGH